MDVWTIANQKGGVGKTTTTVSLGGLLASRGKRVLLIDVDPHGSMTSYFGFDEHQLEHSIYELFQHQGAMPEQLAIELIYKTRQRNLDIMPASMALATLDHQLAHQDGMGMVISKALASLTDDYDIALIDCPPILGVLMINALAASNLVLIPVQTEFLALLGLERMMSSLVMMGEARGSDFPLLIVPTLFDRRTVACVTALRTLRERYGDAVWEQVIPIDTRFRDASLEHLPVSVVAPHCRGVQAYAALLDNLAEAGYVR